jgi:hypothetical protein
MLSIIRFDKQCSCHLQGKCVVVGQFWKPKKGQAVSIELDLMALIGGADELFLPAKFAQPLHIHSEDGNSNVCRNVG